MKRLLALMLSAVMLISLFAGCSKPEEETTTAAPTTAASSEPQNELDKTTVATVAGQKMRTDVIIADGFDIVGFDPPDCNDGYSGTMFTMIYDRLMEFDAAGEVQPMLVESYEMPSKTEYIFKLHEGVKFHNGDEMTAEDVVFSLNRANANPKSQANFQNVIAIEQIDKYSFRIETSVPFAPMLLNLAHTQTSILNKKVVEAAEANGGKYDEEDICGTGPMMHEEYRPNNFYKVVRFDDYWRGKSRMTSLVRKIIPEASSQTIALEAGEIDYIASLNSIDIDRVKANPDLKTVEMVSNNIAYMGFNTTKAPFDNAKVRRALQYASNKEAIVEVLYEGYGIPCTSIFPTVGVGFNDELGGYSFDLEKAKALLAEAGYADGIEFEVTVSSDIRSRAAQILQQDYGQIGVTININLMEFGAMLDYLSRKDHEAWIMSWGGATNPNNTLTNNFHTDAGGPTGNRMWYSNPEVDRMIEEAREEFDVEKRNAIYKEIQAVIMEDSPWIPLLQQTYVAGMHKGLDGVIMHEHGSRYYHDMVVYED